MYTLYENYLYLKNKWNWMRVTWDCLNISMKLKRQAVFFICENKKLMPKADLNITVIFYPVTTEYIYQHVMYSLPHPTVYLSRWQKSKKKSKKRVRRNRFFPVKGKIRLQTLTLDEKIMYSRIKDASPYPPST